MRQERDFVRNTPSQVAEGLSDIWRVVVGLLGVLVADCVRRCLNLSGVCLRDCKQLLVNLLQSIHPLLKLNIVRRELSLSAM